MGQGDLEESVRVEWDSMGELKVPADAYYGAQTMRAVLNFPISDLRFPRTFLRALGPEPWNVAYVEPCRRPTDGRYGDNPNRLQHYFQFQVLMKNYLDNGH
mgnify:CR=1 FL=1